MTKEFCSYEQSLALKELGFDEPCFGYYDLDGLQVITHHWYPENKNSSFPAPQKTNNPKISAPTFSQAFRFFREKYKLNTWVSSKTIDDVKIIYIGNGRTIPDTLKNGFVVDIIPYYPSQTYEEAESACLDKLIEIVKNK